MAKVINFQNEIKKITEQREIDMQREMVNRMRELESDPDYDPSKALQDMIAEEDPKLASLIEDYATVSPQADLGRRRLCGEPIDGTEFEKIRDRKAILEEAKVAWKIRKKI